jgi:hypothetical protein
MNRAAHSILYQESNSLAGVKLRVLKKLLLLLCTIDTTLVQASAVEMKLMSLKFAHTAIFIMQRVPWKN